MPRYTDDALVVVSLRQHQDTSPPSPPSILAAVPSPSSIKGSPPSPLRAHAPSPSPLEPLCSFRCGMAEPCSKSAKVVAVGPPTVARPRPSHSSIKLAGIFLLVPSTFQCKRFAKLRSVASASSPPAAGELAGHAPVAAPRSTPCSWPPSSEAARWRGPRHSTGGRRRAPAAGPAQARPRRASSRAWSTRG